MESKKALLLNLNNKIFKVIDNSNNGEVGDNTFFSYYQKDDTVWADYSGGEIAKGHLLGKKIDESKLEFFYHHINKNGDIKIGQCISEVKIENNQMKLYEQWQWLCDDMSSGTSLLVECE